MSERRGRIHEKHELSKTRRCELLDVARSSAYYRRESVSEADLAVMRLIDEIYLQWPFYGSRRMRDELEERGHTVNRKRVQRLMRQMDLRALYPRRRTSESGLDISYIPMKAKQCRTPSIDLGTLSLRRRMTGCHTSDALTLGHPSRSIDRWVDLWAERGRPAGLFGQDCRYFGPGSRDRRTPDALRLLPAVMSNSQAR